MSFLTDLFKGNTSNLGHDLNPANITADAGKDFSQQPGWAKGLEIALPLLAGTVLTGGLDLPALLGGLGGAGGLAADAGAADVGASLFGDAGIAGQALGDAGVAADTGGALGFAGDVGAGGGLGGGALTGINDALGSAGGVAGQTVGSTEMLPAVAQDAVSGGGGSGLLNWAGNNKGLLALLGAGIGGQVLSPAISQALGLNKVPGAQPLQNLAGNLGGTAAAENAQGQNLQSYLTSGGLPAGQQAQVTQATNDAINSIKSRYAGLGLAGSTAEADAISYAKANAGAVAGQLQSQDYALGQQTINTALQATGMQEQIYNTILNDQIQQDAALGNAIGSFTKAIGTGVGQQAGKQLVTSV